MERLRKALRLTLGTLLHTGSVLALSVTYGDTLPLLSLRDIFPRCGGSLSSKGEALAKR